MIYAFGDFALDTRRCELRRAGEPQHVEPQVYEVLRYVVENRDRLVTKEELLDHVWGHRFITPATLNTRIKALRHVLGDDGSAQRIVRTIRGRGFRFVAGVSAVQDGRADTAATPAPELLERARDLEVLTAALDRARSAGEGSVVLVAGEAGIGKTSLMKAFAAGADARVLVGGCDDLLSPRALGPFRDMAREHEGPLRAAFERGGDPDAVLVGVLDALAERPTTMILEDVHWADDATLDVIRLAARRMATVPAVLVLTYREEELRAGHPLWRVLGALGGARIKRIRLQPLSRDAVARLVAGWERTAEELHQVTRGNPFFVTEVLASPDRKVPLTVRDAVYSRLARLSTAARGLVEAVSVVPSRAERWLADALVPDHFEALVEAERAGVLGLDADHVWFRHELARRAVEDSLPLAARMPLNAAVLDALAARSGSELSRLVHHAREAGEIERMLEYAAQAADEAMRLRAYRQTLDFVDLLLEHEDLLSGPSKGVAYARRGYALYAVNQLEAAARSARRSIELAERHDSSLLAESLLILSRAVYWTEGPAPAAACAERAIGLLEGSPADGRLAAAYADLARARSNLANVGIVAEPDRRVVDAAERSLAIATQLGSTPCQGHALQYVGSGRLALGDLRGLGDLQSAVDLAEVEPRDELPVRACVNAAGAFFRTGRLDEAERYVALGLERARGGEFFAGEYRLALTRAGVWMASGRWDDAVEVLRELISRPGEPGIMRPLARTLLARILGRRGSMAEAWAVLAEAAAAADVSDQIHLVGPVTAASAELAWVMGDGARVRDRLQRGLSLARSVGHGVSEAELIAYLRRAGQDEAPIGHPPGPWAAVLRGDHGTASEEWLALGERYEAAVELHACGGELDRRRALTALDDLGAEGTIRALRRGAAPQDSESGSPWGRRAPL